MLERPKTRSSKPRVGGSNPSGRAIIFSRCAQAVDLAYAATARGGATVTAGLPHPDRLDRRSRIALLRLNLRKSYSSGEKA